MRELERRVLLSVLDRKWREHLYEMDYLREGIYLRAYSQRDPLVEYQREGFDMFAAMMDGIKEEAVGFLFNLEVQVDEDDTDDDVEDEAEVYEPLLQPEGSVPERAPAARHPGQGPGAAHGAPEPHLLGARRRRRGRGRRPRSAPSEDPYAKVGRNQAVPLRLGQEVQAVPRPPRRPHRSDRPRQLAAAARGCAGHWRRAQPVDQSPLVEVRAREL